MRTVAEFGLAAATRWLARRRPAWSGGTWAPFIASVELVISRIEAKVKMSQNRPPADIDGVITGLDARGDHAAAGAVRDAQHR
jgi:predicted FMN-binding regulatory protein PaiB